MRSGDPGPAQDLPGTCPGPPVAAAPRASEFVTPPEVPASRAHMRSRPVFPMMLSGRRPNPPLRSLHRGLARENRRCNAGGSGSTTCQPCCRSERIVMAALSLDTCPPLSPAPRAAAGRSFTRRRRSPTVCSGSWLGPAPRAISTQSAGLSMRSSRSSGRWPIALPAATTDAGSMTRTSRNWPGSAWSMRSAGGARSEMAAWCNWPCRRSKARSNATSAITAGRSACRDPCRPTEQPANRPPRSCGNDGAGRPRTRKSPTPSAPPRAGSVNNGWPARFAGRYPSRHHQAHRSSESDARTPTEFTTGWTT